jgi:glutathione peroxidase
MKKAALFFLVIAAPVFGAAEGFFALEAKSIDGKPTKLSQYAGKLTLVVNTASECGYTAQYKDLQALFDKYKKQGFVVLGFPSNQFGGQEPGSDAEIKKFCEKNFKVAFPMFAKGDVKGESKQPVYQFLVEKSPLKGEVDWNFEKFLVNEKGEVVGRYKSKVTPLDSALEKDIVARLPKKG